MSNNYNFDMNQGATFEMNMIIRDSEGNTRNLTSHTARMQMRSNYGSSDAVISLNTEGGGITIEPSNGYIHVEITATQTAGIRVDMNNKKPPRSVYVYDFELIDANGRVDKLMYGDITVYGEVTR